MERGTFARCDKTSEKLSAVSGTRPYLTELEVIDHLIAVQMVSSLPHWKGAEETKMNVQMNNGVMLPRPFLGARL